MPCPHQFVYASSTKFDFLRSSHVSCCRACIVPRICVLCPHMCLCFIRYVCLVHGITANMSKNGRRAISVTRCTISVGMYDVQKNASKVNRNFSNMGRTVCNIGGVLCLCSLSTRYVTYPHAILRASPTVCDLSDTKCALSIHMYVSFTNCVS